MVIYWVLEQSLLGQTFKMIGNFGNSYCEKIRKIADGGNGKLSYNIEGRHEVEQLNIMVVTI